MRAWVVSRLAQTVLVVFLSLSAVFVMVRLGGDPVLLFMPMDIQARDVEEFRERLGFNDPLAVQYAPGRRAAVVPVHPARDDDQRDRRARPAQHHPQPFRGRMGRVCSRRARRGALHQAAWGTHLDKIKNRNTGDMFLLGWGPSVFGQTVMELLFQATQTYASYGNNKAIDDKIARTVTIVDPKGRAAAYAELHQMIRDEAPWVPLWQQHDLYGVAAHVEWTPRADEKVWMYEARIVPR